MGDYTFKYIMAAELASQPAQQWLIEGLIPEGSLAVLYGPPSAGKSFLALDWSFTIASGSGKWFDKEVKSGPVVYVAAEGNGGIPARINAWCMTHNVNVKELPNEFPITPSINLCDKYAVAAFIEGIKANINTPILVVIDTLARCFTGDENTTRDMGAFIAGADAIREATGAAVLVVHHTGKDSDKGSRGSTALNGAAEVMLELTSLGSVRKLVVKKQRDSPSGDELQMVLTPMGDSAVLCLSPTAQAKTGLYGNHRKVLEVLKEFGSDGCQRKDLIGKTGLDDKSIDRALKPLTERRLVLIEGISRSQNRRYQITTDGTEALANSAA